MEDIFSLLRPLGETDRIALTHEADDEAYQHLLDKERLSADEFIAKQKQNVEQAIESAQLPLDFAASQAGISKVVQLDALLSEDLTPFAYSSRMRKGMKLVEKLFPPTK